MACRVPFSTYNLLFQACFLHNENINSTQCFFSSLTNQNSSVYGKPFCRFPHYFLARLLGIWALPGTKLIFTSIYSDVLIHGHHAYSPSITQSQCINCSTFYRPQVKLLISVGFYVENNLCVLLQTQEGLHQGYFTRFSCATIWPAKCQ